MRENAVTTAFPRRLTGFKGWPVHRVRTAFPAAYGRVTATRDTPLTISRQPRHPLRDTHTHSASDLRESRNLAQLDPPLSAMQLRNRGRKLIRRMQATRWKWLTFQCSSIFCGLLLIIVVVPCFLVWLRPQREAEQGAKLYGFNAPYNQTFLELLPPNGRSDDTELMAEVRTAIILIARS